MTTITRTWTETRTARIILPICCKSDLAEALRALGSHYLDADTRRFFGLRITGIWPTSDGAVWTETTNGSNYSSRRWTYATRLISRSQEQIYAGEPAHSIETIYQDKGDASPRTAAARARRAAEEAVWG